MTAKNSYEVIIIGGSYAGLSAAMALGRSLRKVLIIDSGSPCNERTPHSHNFLTQDGKTPTEITALAKKQVEQYASVNFYKGVAVSATKVEDGFEVKTDSKDKFMAKKLIFTTGIKDIMPDIKGFAACWAISIIHCPYCHGYEYRHQNTAIMANGEKALHVAGLVSNLTKKITILTNGKADFNEAQIEQLKKHHIKIIETKITEIAHENGQLKSIHLEEGNKLDFDVAYAAIPFIQHSDIPQSLGCEITDLGYIKVDDFQKTTTEGVFAAGDNTVMMRSIANAVYSGNLTGAVVNGLLAVQAF